MERIKLTRLAAILLPVLLLFSACSESPAFEYREGEDFVTLSVTDNEGNELLPVQKAAVRDGATVYDCTRYLLQKNKMQYEAAGAGTALYIKGIDNLYERDKGPQSGWLYRVNGSFDSASMSCAKHPAKNGDVIEWIYTVDMGADAGAKQE